MLSERSVTEPERQVRFSSLPPSTPLLTFDVLEWSPEERTGAGPLARLQAWRASAERRSESHASVGSSEEAVDRRDRTAFGDALGSWTCFRALSCCGDRLVLEDAAMVDAGPARRGDFTWQLGPGRLSATGAHQDWRQVLSAAAADGASASPAELVTREALIRGKRSGKKTGAQPTPPSKREIQLQDIHSMRRHCFQSPVPLVFNAHGHEAAAAADDGDAHGKRQRARQRNGHHRRDSSAEKPGQLRWRYELWGPVGLIFTLRGGHRLYLAFASAQLAEQMEQLLTDFAAGVGLTRRLRHGVLSPRRHNSGSAGGGSIVMVPTWTSGDGMPAPGSPSVASASAVAGALAAVVEVGSGSMGDRLSQRRVQRTPSASLHSPRLVSCEASFQLAASPPITPRVPSYMASASGFSTAQPPPTPVSPRGVLVEVPPPAAAPTSPRTTTAASPPRAPPLPSAAAAPPRETATVVVAPPPPRSRGLTSAPGSGYLYCRPWAEVGKRRRYYVKLSTRPGTHHLLHLSRHRLRLWQRLHHALAHEPRPVSLDLRRTTVTASTTNDRLLQVSSLVDSFAQYRDVEPLGGGVALAGPANESAAVRAMRRRETELCTGRPVIFEALTKSAADRAAWLSWLRGVGAAVVEPAAAPAATATTTASVGPTSASDPHMAPLPAFTPLGGERFVALPGPSAAARDGGLESAAQTLSSQTVLSPHLPMRERPEGPRGGSFISGSLPLSRGPSLSAASPSPLNPHLSRKASDVEAEPSIVVEDDERDGVPVDAPCGEVLSLDALNHSAPSSMVETVSLSRRSSAAPLPGDEARHHTTTGGHRLVTRVPPAASAVAAQAPSSPFNGRWKRVVSAEETVVVAATTQKYLDDTTSSLASSPHSARVASSLSPGKETLTATVQGASPTQPPSANSPQSQTPSTRDPTPREHGGAATRRRPVSPTTKLDKPESPGSARPPTSPSDVAAASASPSPPPPPGRALTHSRASDAGEPPVRHSSKEAAAAVAAMESLVARLSRRDEDEEDAPPPLRPPQRGSSRSPSPDAPLENAPAQALRGGSVVEAQSPSVWNGHGAQHVDPSRAAVHSPNAGAPHDTSSASPSAASLAGLQQVAPHGAADRASSSVSSAPSPSSGSPPSPPITTGVDARLGPFLTVAAHEQHTPLRLNSAATNGEGKLNHNGGRDIELSSGAPQGEAPRAVATTSSATVAAPQAASHAHVAPSPHHVLPGSASLRDSKLASPPRLSSASAATLSSGGGSYARAAQEVRRDPLHASSSSTPQHTPSNASRLSSRGSEPKGSPGSSPGWDVVEQRRRAFRESLFIHQDEV